ncbi:hypothetical protein EVAR_75824_1 [Eumeta japonica]|uniref:Uncharacterized protein n=1 Tax=Eumeta variegata TaxID=151549 RepID=A0A4C1TE69_EUMVA|nr:hypothetical protein EVAR_75824_1 [Eumeta japonica]
MWWFRMTSTEDNISSLRLMIETDKRVRYQQIRTILSIVYGVELVKGAVSKARVERVTVIVTRRAPIVGRGRSAAAAAASSCSYSAPAAPIQRLLALYDLNPDGHGSSFIFIDLTVNSDLAPYFNSGPGAVSDFNLGHALLSNSVPVSAPDCAPWPACNFDTAIDHGSDL